MQGVLWISIHVLAKLELVLCRQVFIIHVLDKKILPILGMDLDYLCPINISVSGEMFMLRPKFDILYA